MPTDWRATLFPFETLAPDLPYEPYIDPRLSPWVEHALARLQSCQPAIYLNVREYVKRYDYSDEKQNDAVVMDGAVELAAGSLQVPDLSSEATEVSLMGIIAHESRHIWQSANGHSFLSTAAEYDAYSYELPVYSCPTTDPDGAAYLRAWTQGHARMFSK